MLVNLITISDFSNPYMVVADNAQTETRLNEIITEVQDDLLNRVLSSQLYYELQNDNGGAFPTTQKWIDFINGVVYVKDLKNMNYIGFKRALMYQVYYYYNVWVSNLLSQNGNTQIVQKTGMQVVPKRKMVQAFNKSVDLLGGCGNYIYEPTIYNYLEDTDGFDDNEFDLFEKLTTIF